MIGVDWGTSSFRAFLLSPDGTIRDRREGARGIMTVPAGGFPSTLREEIGHWLEAGERQVLLCGMVGSRQGWRETPALPCPAGIAEMAGAVIDLPFDGARAKLVPGLTTTDEAGVPEFIRGEETQLAGLLGAALAGDGVACLPGSHSKWAHVAGGRVTSFTTHMTGEAFAALRGHTILGRMMREGPPDGKVFDWATFERGVARAGEPGGLLHHLFGVRTLGLTEDSAASYLSGLLIGHEVASAMPAGAVVQLIGGAALTGLYARAIAMRGGKTISHDPDAAAAGLTLIGRLISWT
jgi:2-dehydro-3-deoxygalactonokinase